jgi:CRISPR-associated endonuclease/helicase Cas3
MQQYYRFYFYDRAAEMDYPVSMRTIGHDDTLLNLLSSNSQAVAEFKRRHDGKAPNMGLRQSFMTAARAFKAIDAPTRGVVVPYTDVGRDLIADLCGSFEVEKQRKLLRNAQQFTVNVFPHVLERLESAGAVRPIQEGTRILYLDPRYYSREFGLATEPIGPMEVYCV